MSTLNAQEQVRKVFSTFLEENKQRKTPERFYTQEVYESNDHFDVETCI